MGCKHHAIECNSKQAHLSVQLLLCSIGLAAECGECGKSQPTSRHQVAVVAMLVQRLTLRTLAQCYILQ